MNNAVGDARYAAAAGVTPAGRPGVTTRATQFSPQVTDTVTHHRHPTWRPTLLDPSRLPPLPDWQRVNADAAAFLRDVWHTWPKTVAPSEPEEEEE